MRLISDWQMVPWDTPANEQRRRDLGRADALLSNPDAMRAFVARCRLLAEAGSSPAARCGEPSTPAGAVGSADGPGPAADLFGRLNAR